MQATLEIIRSHPRCRLDRPAARSAAGSERFACTGNGLAKMDERLSQAVELFYFGGLTYDEIAEALGTSRATVDRDLRFARAWLRRELAPADETGGGDGA